MLIYYMAIPCVIFLCIFLILVHLLTSKTNVYAWVSKFDHTHFDKNLLFHSQWAPVYLALHRHSINAWYLVIKLYLGRNKILPTYRVIWLKFRVLSFKFSLTSSLLLSSYCFVNFFQSHWRWCLKMYIHCRRIKQ